MQPSAKMNLNLSVSDSVEAAADERLIAAGCNSGSSAVAIPPNHRTARASSLRQEATIEADTSMDPSDKPHSAQKALDATSRSADKNKQHGDVNSVASSHPPHNPIAQWRKRFGQAARRMSTSSVGDFAKNQQQPGSDAGPSSMLPLSSSRSITPLIQLLEKAGSHSKPYKDNARGSSNKDQPTIPSSSQAVRFLDSEVSLSHGEKQRENKEKNRRPRSVSAVTSYLTNVTAHARKPSNDLLLCMLPNPGTSSQHKKDNNAKPSTFGLTSLFPETKAQIKMAESPVSPAPPFSFETRKIRNEEVYQAPDLDFLCTTLKGWLMHASPNESLPAKYNPGLLRIMEDYYYVAKEKRDLSGEVEKLKERVVKVEGEVEQLKKSVAMRGRGTSNESHGGTSSGLPRMVERMPGDQRQEETRKQEEQPESKNGSSTADTSAANNAKGYDEDAGAEASTSSNKASSKRRFGFRRRHSPSKEMAKISQKMGEVKVPTPPPHPHQHSSTILGASDEEQPPGSMFTANTANDLRDSGHSTAIWSSLRPPKQLLHQTSGESLSRLTDSDISSRSGDLLPDEEENLIRQQNIAAELTSQNQPHRNLDYQFVARPRIDDRPTLSKLMDDRSMSSDPKGLSTGVDGKRPVEITPRHGKWQTPGSSRQPQQPYSHRKEERISDDHVVHHRRGFSFQPGDDLGFQPTSKHSPSRYGRRGSPQPYHREPDSAPRQGVVAPTLILRRPKNWPLITPALDPRMPVDSSESSEDGSENASHHGYHDRVPSKQPSKEMMGKSLDGTINESGAVSSANPEASGGSGGSKGPEETKMALQQTRMAKASTERLFDHRPFSRNENRLRDTRQPATQVGAYDMKSDEPLEPVALPRSTTLQKLLGRPRPEPEPVNPFARADSDASPEADTQPEASAQLTASSSLVSVTGASTTTSPRTPPRSTVPRELPHHKFGFASPKEQLSLSASSSLKNMTRPGTSPATSPVKRAPGEANLLQQAVSPTRRASVGTQYGPPPPPTRMGSERSVQTAIRWSPRGSINSSDRASRNSSSPVPSKRDSIEGSSAGRPRASTRGSTRVMSGGGSGGRSPLSGGSPRASVDEMGVIREGEPSGTRRSKETYGEEVSMATVAAREASKRSPRTD